MSTRKLVVTGGYGFVGTHLLIAAAQGGYDLVDKYAGQVSSKVTTAYNSSVQAPMSRDDLRCHLVENGLLDGA